MIFTNTVRDGRQNIQRIFQRIKIAALSGRFWEESLRLAARLHSRNTSSLELPRVGAAALRLSNFASGG